MPFYFSLFIVLLAANYYPEIQARIGLELMTQIAAVSFGIFLAFRGLDLAGHIEQYFKMKRIGATP